jgi:parallel beta-helix repeat protein
LDYNDKKGIYCGSCTGKIIDNYINGSLKGVKLYDSLDVTNVEENYFKDCGDAIDADPSIVIIKDNIIQNCTIGIKVDHSFVIITGNIITGCTYGIYIYYSDPVISDNYFSDNFYAIFIAEGSDPIITNNTFVNNTYNNYSMIWSIDIDPDTLNLDSEGKWITCYIEPTEGIDLTVVDISTIRISEIAGIPVMIPAEDHPTNIGDHDEDGVPDLMIKFDRNDVQDASWPGDIEITITGELKDGTPFEGYYIIRVINPGK